MKNRTLMPNSLLNFRRCYNISHFNQVITTILHGGPLVREYSRYLLKKLKNVK